MACQTELLVLAWGSCAKQSQGPGFRIQEVGFSIRGFGFRGVYEL